MFKRSALANFLLPCGERSPCINIGTSVLTLVGSVAPIRRIDVKCMIYTGQARAQSITIYSSVRLDSREISSGVPDFRTRNYLSRQYTPLPDTVSMYVQ